MPWKETCIMDQRRAFIEAWLSREFTMAELCRRFDIAVPAPCYTGTSFAERAKFPASRCIRDISRRNCAPP